MTRIDVEFISGGTICRGWFYPAPGPAPAVLLSHGLSAVIDQRLDPFARAFQAAGIAALAFDYRHLGRSDGMPRGQVIPQAQHDDLRAALGWLAAQPGIDPGRIGLWGTSYSGGHALHLAALDPRIRAVVAQVPAVAVGACLQRQLGAGFAGFLGMLAEEHGARSQGAAPATIPVVDPTGGACVMGVPDAAEWFLGTQSPTWVNAMTLESVARAVEYVPDALIDWIAPRPLLMIVAEHDSLIPVDLARAAYSRAGEPKRLEAWPCGHFDLYQTPPWHDRAVAAARDWFVAHLVPGS